MAIAGDLIINVVAGFVTDGLRRAYHEIRIAGRRRQIIDKALSGQTKPEQTKDRLHRSINDLHVIIGSATGQLTEEVAAFIREVERSSIPETMASCALLSGDPQSLYPQFEAIFNTFSNLPFDCSNFFKAFYEAIRFRIEEEVKDPALLEFIQAQHGIVIDQLDEIAKSIAEYRSSETLKAEEIYDARLRLARALEASNRYLILR